MCCTLAGYFTAPACFFLPEGKRLGRKHYRNEGREVTREQGRKLWSWSPRLPWRCTSAPIIQSHPLFFLFIRVSLRFRAAHLNGVPFSPSVSRRQRLEERQVGC
ncbi:hypothetical protein HPB50_016498 [Hyalomma asiaticum]|uniref:Uncharacterized protein n=1 Tax=Hyalomma asiaticum TaxID=266040 RepID=A0ACB7SWW6_HYAAI|nr:hypothetical protein HPB50_016498 [Hyalomma asiaticum]